MKSLKWIFLLFIISNTYANENDINTNVLNALHGNDKIETKEENKEATVILIPHEEKVKLLRDKIEFLKQDIAKWKEREKELLQIKAEFETKINNNNKNIEQWQKDIIDMTQKIKEQEADLVKETESINKENEEINIGQNLLIKDSEIISVPLANGKKIKLIKYIVFPGDSLSKIIMRTYDKNSQSTTSVKERIDTVIKLNKNIKDANSIKVGDTIYIPFFK
jgi:hypothetical protein